jgi:hypothetical protein
MTFTIFGGSSVDITVGKVIQVVPGYLPSKFDGALLPVVRVDESGPYVALEPSMISADEEVDVNALSCVSPQIIKAVL